MVDETRTICPVCNYTGKCIICDGKGKCIVRIEKTKGLGPFKKKEIESHELKCDFCSKTGKCLFCHGKGYFEPALSEAEKEFCRKRREYMVKAKEYLSKVQDFEKFRKEHGLAPHSKKV